ncbi:MAG: hypothetical protein ABIU06_06275 [Anaerolineales bacterium]
MENKTDKKKFMKNLIAIGLGLIMFAALISFSSNFSFGIILFSLGILVDGIATVLGASRQVLYGLISPLREYSIESAMFYAGGIAILVSAPFLCQIMFGK